MAKQPIGKLDHIGIAVKSIEEARKFYEGVLGATFMYDYERREAGFRFAEFDLAGTIIELLEPLGEDSFMHKFIAEHGEGFHHITFDVPDTKDAHRRTEGVRGACCAGKGTFADLLRSVHLAALVPRRVNPDRLGLPDALGRSRMGESRTGPETQPEIAGS